jgi:hypothetical protein
MAFSRIFPCAGLAALALAPANLSGSSEAEGTAPVAYAAAVEGMAAGEPATSAVLLGGALILMIAGRRRRY